MNMALGGIEKLLEQGRGRTLGEGRRGVVQLEPERPTKAKVLDGGGKAVEASTYGGWLWVNACAAALR
jgi:hypothetical protein